MSKIHPRAVIRNNRELLGPKCRLVYEISVKLEYSQISSNLVIVHVG